MGVVDVRTRVRHLKVVVPHRALGAEGGLVDLSSLSLQIAFGPPRDEMARLSLDDLS